MRTRHICVSIAVWAIVTAGAACTRGVRGDLAPATAPPAMAAVGPIPGPVKTRPEAGNPYSGDRASATEGHTYFNRFNCAGCHGDHGGGGMGPSLRDVDWIYGSSDAQVFSSIAQGRANGMPAWGARLNQDEIWKLVTYVHTLRTPLEPEPPR
jgi:cytochrome c oxidase cbb3-type subunit 3